VERGADVITFEFSLFSSVLRLPTSAGGLNVGVGRY
jgi:hypothetical protein